MSSSSPQNSTPNTTSSSPPPPPPLKQTSLYEDIMFLLYSSYLVQDIALFDHWRDVTVNIPVLLPAKPLEDPDFFKTFPRKLSEIHDWFQKNHDAIRGGTMKPPKNMDIDFDLEAMETINEFLALLEEEAATADLGQQQEEGGKRAKIEEPTIELLDDEFGFSGTNSNIVYSIIRRPNFKQILVVFRGSVSAKDWEEDARVKRKEVPLDNFAKLSSYVPNLNEELLEGLENIHIHSGFHEYLFGKEPVPGGEDSLKNVAKKSVTIIPKVATAVVGQTVSAVEHLVGSSSTTDAPTQQQHLFHRGTSDNKTHRKFRDIVKEIMKQLKDPKNEGYSLCFTGHSLGGSLATLAAYAICLSKDLDSIVPVKLVTFAAPHVGKLNALELFDKLSQAGRIQHLRVTNDDDVIPQGLKIFGYRQNGMNLNLGKTKYTLEPSSPHDESIINTNLSAKSFMGNPSHRMKEHMKRLKHVAKDDLSLKTFADLFDNQDPK